MISSNTRKLSLFIALLGSVAIMTACDGRRERPSELDSDATFDVASIDIKETDVRADESDRNVEYRTFHLEACMIDRLNRASILDSVFTVSDGETEKKVKSDAVTGCIRWTESHRINVVGGQTFLRIKRSFSSSREYSGTVNLELGFNPHAKQIVDLRKVSPSNVEKDVRPLTFNSQRQLLDIDQGNKSMLNFPNLYLKFQGHEKEATEINELLRLKLTQRFIMRVTPQFLQTNLENNVEVVGGRGGEFHISIFLFPETVYSEKTQTNVKTFDDKTGAVNMALINPNNLIAELDNDSRAIYNGLVEQDVTLKIHDIAAAQNRNFALIVVEPLGELARHSNMTVFYGQVPPMRGNDLNIEVRPLYGIQNSPAEQSALVAKLETAQQRANKSISGLQNLKNEFKAAPVTGLIQKTLAGQKTFVVDPKLMMAVNMSSADPMSGMRAQEQAYKFTQDYKDLQSYCDVVYPENVKFEIPKEDFFALDTLTTDGLARRVGRLFKKSSDARAYCKQYPEKMVGVQLRDMVEKIEGVKHVPAPPRQRSISIDRGVGVSWGQSASGGQNIGASLSASLPVGEGKLLGVGLGANVSAGGNFTLSRSYSRDKTVSARLSESQSLTVYSDSYEIDAVTKRCVIIQPGYVDPKNPKAFTSVYHCAPRSARVKRIETYHLVNHSRDNSVMNDNDAATSSAWRLTIRGENSLRDFEQMLTTKNTILSMDRFIFFGGVDLESPLLPDKKVTQDLEGALLTK